MKGTVTISIDDFEKLTKNEDRVKTKEDNLYTTAKELSVFLSFLSTRTDIKKYVEQYNLQSTTSKIVFEGNKAIIEFRK